MTLSLAFWMSDAPVILAFLFAAVIQVIGAHYDKSNA